MGAESGPKSVSPRRARRGSHPAVQAAALEAITTTGDFDIVGHVLGREKPTGKLRQALAWAAASGRNSNGNGLNHEPHNELPSLEGVAPVVPRIVDAEITLIAPIGPTTTLAGLNGDTTKTTDLMTAGTFESQPVAEEEKFTQETPNPLEGILSSLPKAHIDMLDPDPSKVNFAELIKGVLGREAYLYAIHKFMTPEQRKVVKMKYLQRHPKVKTKEYHKMQQRYILDLREAIDSSRIPQGIARVFQLDEREDPPMRFYERQMRHSHAVLRFIQTNTAPRHLGVIGLKTEPGLIVTDPDDIVTYTFDSDVDPRVQFEQRRDDTIALPCAEVDIYMRESGVEDRLREVTKILNKDLFVGKWGASTRKNFAVVHDRKTNRALRYDELNENQTIDDMPHKPATEIVRPLPLEMRQFQGTGIMALYDPRAKDIPAAIAKAFQEALDRKEKGEDGTVYPLKDVRDLVGMKFVVDDRGDPSVVDRALIQVFDTLVDNGIGLEVEEDHKTNGTEDQSPGFRFKRIKLWGTGNNGLPIGFEIVFQSVLEHANNEKEVGEFNAEKGRYMGQWHRGYDTERLIKGKSGGVAKLFFPPEIYNIDIVEEAIKTKNRKAQEELLA